jgi:leader peptidase (prepilin peptidase) / N-methyltransferase
MLSPLAFELPAFLLGLLFGSFLNVCISRLPEHRSISKPRSHCPHCGHTIRWFDNIPLLSWLLLQAKCRKCRAPVSWQYPFVELITGIWFFVGGNRLWQSFFVEGYIPVQRSSDASIQLAILAVGFTILGFLLIGLLVMDWQTHILPNAFTFAGIAIGFFLVCLQAVFLPTGADDIRLNPRHSLRMSSPGSFAARGNVFLTGTERLVFGRLAAIVGAILILLLVRWLYKAIRRQEGLGLGDVKLLAMIAAFLGFWPSVLALFIAFITAAVFAVYLLLRRNATSTTPLPFGSFLCLGGLVAALAGEPMIAWYRSLL